MISQWKGLRRGACRMSVPHADTIQGWTPAQRGQEAVACQMERVYEVGLEFADETADAAGVDEIAEFA